MSRWIFEHQFVLTWVKDRLGQRPKKSEFCIMATHGSSKFNSTNPTTVIEAPARQKNRKPD
jgi:N6-adenosine-specific RNA methylase IME4